MLQSLKKSSDPSSSGLVSAWHPNFRNVERLPDTKVVRTAFFLNGMAVSVAVALAIYAGYSEYGLSALRAETENAQNAIQANKPASDQAVALFKKFQEEERKIFALRDFLAPTRFAFSDFILHLGDGLPQAVKIYSIDSKSNGVILRGGIDGTPDEASGRAIAYVEDLKKNETVSKLFESVSLTNIVRDPTSGRMQFVIDLKLKAPGKTSQGKK